MRNVFTLLLFAKISKGTVVSFGGGGDSIADAIFTVADSALLASQVARILLVQGPARDWIRKIYQIEWNGDPYAVKKVVDQIFDEIEADSDATAIKEQMCEVFSSIMDQVAALFGSLLSLFIPE